MSVSYTHYSSSIGRAMMHMCFVCKYRHKIFRFEEIKSRCTELFYSVAEQYGMKIEELGFDKDHVHMLVDLGNKQSPANAAKLFKGISARYLMKEFLWLREKYFWSGHLWSPAYFFDGVGQNTYDNMKRYVKAQ